MVKSKYKLIVAVGSENKTKIQPVQAVFQHHFSNVEVVGVKVKSGVAEQPLTDEEAFKGAYNRAKQALKKVPTAEYGVGIEGGVHQHSYGWFERSLVVIIDRQGNTGIGASGGLILPKKVSEQILEGKTLEQAVDTLFGTREIGEGIGMFGLFTKGVVTRAEGVKHGVAFALARFLHQSLYD